MANYATYDAAHAAWQNYMRQLKTLKASIDAAEAQCQQARAAAAGNSDQMNQLLASSQDALQQMRQLLV
jgi:ABC-type transporter Mla subunit MlaD